MTTQKQITFPLGQMPYGYEFGLDLMNFAGKVTRAIKTFFTALDEAIELCNRYAELDRVNAVHARGTLAKMVAQEAGLIAPAANNNDRDIRPAA